MYKKLTLPVLILGVALFAILAAVFVSVSNASINRLGFESSDAGLDGDVNELTDPDASDGSYIALGNEQLSDYDIHLARILNSNTRNKNHDGSQFTNTPSAQLPLSQLFGSHTDYRSINDLGATGNFRVECEFSHFAYDDPIILPDQPGKAHLHMFFGNTHSNAYSDYSSLIDSGSSTCNGQELNRTSYWVPALIDGQGYARVPNDVTVYYKSYGPAVGQTIVYPPEMRFISGDAMATSPQPGTNSFREFFFRCFLPGTGGNNSVNTKHVTIPNCPSTHVLEMNVKFQTCWNGNDPSNYVANAAYSNVWPTSGQCPSSHPINLPQMEYRIFYTHDGNSSSWFLSSDVSSADGRTKTGSGLSIHGDWYGAWNREINQAWIDNCVNISGADCGGGMLADPDQPVYANNPNALKRRPPYTGPNRIPGWDILSQVCDSGKTYSVPTSIAYCYRG